MTDTMMGTMMGTVWLVVLGMMLTGWSVLDGANLGTGMWLRRLGSNAPERRLVLTAVGPFLLAGEVWLVAGAGVLLGAFPALEKDLLGACYPIVVTLVLAWVVRDAGVWFRSRRRSPRWRDGWERAVVAASGMVAGTWGMLLANIAQGVPRHEGPRLGTLVQPYSLLWGVTMVAVFTLHGAVFTALRVPRERRAPAVRIARGAARPVVGLLAATVIATPFLGADAPNAWLALPVALVAVAAAVLAPRRLHQNRDGQAFACTAVLAAAPVLAVGVATAPRLLDGAAGPGTLDLLAGTVLPVIPVLVAVQAWLWWTFRRRVDTGSAVFF